MIYLWSQQSKLFKNKMQHIINKESHIASLKCVYVYLRHVWHAHTYTQGRCHDFLGGQVDIMPIAI